MLEKQAAVTTDYIDGIQLEAGAIVFIQTEEGIARKDGGSYSYEYQLTDHLGNSRYNFDISGGAVRKIQEEEYYPFGLSANRYTYGDRNNYLYNGKELQDELGQYDYGARFYDPVTARWNAVDILSELYDDVSVYNYVFNNPMSYIDLYGMGPDPGQPGFKYEAPIIPLTFPRYPNPDPSFNPSFDLPRLDPNYQPSNNFVNAADVAAKLEKAADADRSTANKNNHGGGARKAFATTLGATVSASEVPPVAVGILILGIGYTAYKAFTAGPGNGNYPGPWRYTYQHPSQNPINNTPGGFDPKEPPSGMGTAAKWLVGGKLLYEIYDEYQQRMNQIGVQPNIAPRDNTNVVQPQFIPHRPR